MTKVLPNFTEFQIGQRVYWRESVRGRWWMWGEIIGIFVDELWLVPHECSIEGGPFRTTEPPQGAHISVTLRARFVSAEPAWTHTIPGPLPHERP